MILISMAGLHNLESDEGHTPQNKTKQNKTKQKKKKTAGHRGRFWWGDTLLIIL